jgi:GNAT superfamily N-acetyltransferase
MTSPRPSPLKIRWKVERYDEDPQPDPAIADDCALKIEGRTEVRGEAAGQFLVWYLSANDLESPRAFVELWDLEGETCEVYEEIMNPERTKFREPLMTMLNDAPGLIVIDFIALRPAFRRKGLGREVMEEIVRCCANQWISAVLLDARPLQRRPGGYDHFDEEVRDLPWSDGDEDLARLMHHFRGWGMQRLPRTRFMVCVPDMITGERAKDWPPAPIAEGWDEDDDDLPF